jgi:hypothetical protein
LNWLEARQQCLSQGADLINLEDPNDKNVFNFWIPFSNFFRLPSPDPDIMFGNMSSQKGIYVCG